MRPYSWASATIKAKKVNKPMGGHFAKQGIEPTRYLREVRVEDAAEYKAAATSRPWRLSPRSKKVDVTGTSKGKGFAGVMKRYGFARRPGRPWCSLPPRSRFGGPCAPRLPACSRACACLVTWAATPSPSRT